MQRGVYRFRGVPDSFEIRARAACLYTGEECAISHQAAAFLHGLEEFTQPQMLAMLVPARLRLNPSGVVVHSTEEPFQSIDENGIRITSLARTLIDLSDQLTMDELEKVLNAAWRKRSTICPWLRQEITPLKRKEWKGLDRLCQLLSRMDNRGLDSDPRRPRMEGLEDRSALRQQGVARHRASDDARRVSAL